MYKISSAVGIRVGSEHTQIGNGVSKIMGTFSHRRLLQWPAVGMLHISTGSADSVTALRMFSL